MKALDKIDIQIISKLQQDGRADLKELAEITGYTSMGVKKRLENLQKRGVIRVAALLNVELLGLFAAILLLEMENGEAVNNLLQRFKDCPRVVRLLNTLGSYNVVAFLVAEDRNTLESICLEKCSLRGVKGIRRSELLPVGDIHYSPFMPVRQHLSHLNMKNSPCNVDCESCRSYQENKCVGCPATQYYRGTI